MYHALYRKWRPLVFSGVVGQRHVTDTLRNELRSGRLSHAYLFTGTRGTGKTTCAKILARAVNCEEPSGGDPCNNCPACRGILSGNAPDITEMDAASYTGVDNIRALRDELAYLPATVKMRVYIIDEVHMLSTGAFNALLTVLEEPPPHVLFILATTEMHKVPATVVSRCQRFAFRRISPADILDRLMGVAGEEGIDLTQDAGRILTRLADGALRDALSLLDQCAAANRGQTLDPPAVYAALGMAGLGAITELARAVAARDAGGALSLLRSLYESGRDLSSVLDEFCILLRDLLLSLFQKNVQSLSGLDDKEMGDIAGAFGKSRLLHAITLLQETQGLLARGGNRRVDMELCLLRLCDERLSLDITALEARVAALERNVASRSGHSDLGMRASAHIPALGRVAGGGDPAAKAADAPTAAKVADAPPVPKAAEPPKATEPPTAKAAEPPTAVKVVDTPPVSRAAEPPKVVEPPAAPAARTDPSGFDWTALLDTLDSGVNFLIRAHLARAHVSLAGRRLTISVESPAPRQLQDKALLSLLEEKASLQLGQPVEVVVTTNGLPGQKESDDPLEGLIRRGGSVVQLSSG